MANLCENVLRISGAHEDVVRFDEKFRGGKDMKDENREAITRVVDRYLEGYQPFSMAPGVISTRGLTYDELMDELTKELEKDW